MIELRLRVSLIALLCFGALGMGGRASGQSTTSLTQTVNQRNTIGVLSISPSTGLLTGMPVTIRYTLHTAGAPAPTAETLQLYDNGIAVGAGQSITSIPGSNLLPYSQVDPGHSWLVSGTVATLTPASVAAPDGTTSTATQIAFPDTTVTASNVRLAVPGTAYAGQPMTMSLWAKSATPTTLTLTLADSPALNASSSTGCALTTAWQRCTLTYTFPANAGTGFSATLTSSGNAAVNTQVWGAQVEQATAAGPYVATIGTARASGAQGGAFVQTVDSLPLVGTHSFTIGYSGDSNLAGSTSNAVILAFTKDTPVITLSASPASNSAYGQSITFTVHALPGVPTSIDIPAGTIQFFDGATSLGTVTLDGSGFGAISFSGAASLPVGVHTITAVYAGSPDFTTATSAPLTYTVTTANNVVTIGVTSSNNPSVYGDAVTFTIVVASPVGAIPTGTVQLKDGATVLGSATLDGTGKATYTVPLLNAGSHTLTIIYSGDSNYN